jgi:glucose-6-phosphate isomerase
MPFDFDIEFYPKISQSLILNSLTEIKKNMKNWGSPFFKDVYSHSNLEEYKNTCKSFVDGREINHLIVIGTGGSIQTLLAIEGLFKIKLHPIVSSRPRELNAVLKECPPSTSIVIPISRGGKTLDVNSTLKQFSKYRILPLSSRGPMYDYFKNRVEKIIPVPDLAGRFAASICSVVLIPAILGSLDVDLFLKALDKSYSDFMNLVDPLNNAALSFAVFLKSMYEKGYKNVFNMPYSSYLEGAAGLFVQELSESTGKEGKGFLGTMQPAPFCQHSVLELLLGGSKGHTIPLIWSVEKEPNDIEISNPELGLQNLTASDVISYQTDATFQTLLEQKIPSAKIQIKKIGIEDLACTIAFIQSTVYLLCLLFNVDWESNPLINSGKKISNDAIKDQLSVNKRREIRRDITKSWNI